MCGLLPNICLQTNTAIFAQEFWFKVADFLKVGPELTMWCDLAWLFGG